MMGGLRPPGASQGKADYFVPGSSPSPPASSEQPTKGENEAIGGYDHGEKITTPVIPLYEESGHDTGSARHLLLTEGAG